ncbi:MAG: DNA glycosylase [Clostridia bacterium]
MDYKVFEDRIELEETEDFCAKHIFECGQIFRYKKTENGYLIFSDNQKIIVEEKNGKVTIWGNPKFCQNFFDLKTDYSKIKAELIKNKELTMPIKFGYGIRILKRSPLETIISFIISANNNIPRIKNTIEKLCNEYGENKGDFFSFPTLKKLSLVDEKFWINAGAGYRAKYLIDTVKILALDSSVLTSNESTTEIKKKLLALSGVGPKVADCVLLFGYGRTDVFPTDTWVMKAIGENDKSKASFFATEKASQYGSLAGYAQQYLFFYERNKKA